MYVGKKNLQLSNPKFSRPSNFKDQGLLYLEVSWKIFSLNACPILPYLLFPWQLQREMRLSFLLHWLWSAPALNPCGISNSISYYYYSHPSSTKMLKKKTYYLYHSNSSNFTLFAMFETFTRAKSKRHAIAL